MKVCKEHLSWLRRGVTYTPSDEDKCDICNIISLSPKKAKFIAGKVKPRYVLLPKVENKY